MQLPFQLRHQRLDGSGRGARDADGRARRPRHLLHLLPEQRRLEIRAPQHTPAPASFASAHRSANVRESFVFSAQVTAYEESQKYKEGRFIIEKVHMQKDNSWGRAVRVPSVPAAAEG